MADNTYEETGYFQLRKPGLGTFYGNWNTPINFNFDKIDDALFSIRTCNKDLGEDDVIWDGALWYGILTNTEEECLYLKKSGEFRKVLTNTDIAWDGLKGGWNSIVELHSHPGYSSQYFRVRNPEQASDGNTDKQYFAVNYDLFKTNIDRIDGLVSELREDLDAETAKLNGISEDGINLHIGSINATGNISADGYLQAKAGTTGVDITIGGGASADEVELKITRGIAVNLKSVDSGTSQDTELQVEGNKVWHLGNQGASSMMDSDKVDGRDVDDTRATTNNLWTAEKTKYEIEHKTQTTVDLAGRLKIGTGDSSGIDGSYFAVKSEHNALRSEFDTHNDGDSADHDTHNDGRYAKLAGDATVNFKVKDGVLATDAISKAQLDKKKIHVFQYTIKTGEANPYLTTQYKNVNLGIYLGTQQVEDDGLHTSGVQVSLANFITQWVADNPGESYIVIPILTRSKLSKWMGAVSPYNTKKFERTEARFDNDTKKVYVRISDMEIHNYSSGYSLYGTCEAVLTILFGNTKMLDDITLTDLGGEGSLTGQSTQYSGIGGGH